MSITDSHDRANPTLQTRSITAASRASRKLPRGLTWLAVGTFALGTESFVIAGVLPQIADDLSIGRPTAGLLVALFAVTYGVSAPIVSSLTTRHKPKAVLQTTMTLFVLANLAAAIAPSFAGLLGARMAAAVFASAFTPTASATASSLAEPEHRGRALALIFGGMSLAMIAGVPLGTVLANVGSWRTTFLFVACLGTVAVLGIHRFVPSTPAPSAAAHRQPRLSVLRIPGLPRCLSVAILIFAGHFAIFTYLADVITDLYGNATISVPIALLATGTAGAIGNNLSGKLTDSHGVDAALLIAMVGTVAGLAALALSNVLPGPLASLVATCGLLVWSVAAWGFGPPQQTRMLELAPGSPTIALAANASASQLGIGIGGFAGAATIATTSTGWLPAVAAALALCALLVNRTVRPLRHQTVTGNQPLPAAALDVASVCRQLVTAGSITTPTRRQTRAVSVSLRTETPSLPAQLSNKCNQTKANNR